MEPDVLHGIDYTQVEGIQRKRVLKFVNHFIIQLSNFLSNFSQTCDVKLCHLATKIQNVETSLTLLEHKIESLPKTLPPEPQNSEFEHEEISTQKSEENLENQIDEKIEELSPEIINFKKMLDVGVPENAVRQKMKVQGFGDHEISEILKKIKF